MGLKSGLRIRAWVAIAILIYLLPSQAAIAAVSRHVDTETGLVGWKLQEGGIELELIQRLPDQTRAFFQARGFSAGIADDIATSCVFQTIVRNTSRGKQALPVTISLTQWRIKLKNELRPIKLKEDWDREWPEGQVSSAARIAFRWATFPTEQTFEPGGDYNWGMTSFGLPPGEKFDLHLFWNVEDQSDDVWIRRIECPDDR